MSLVCLCLSLSGRIIGEARNEAGFGGVIHACAERAQWQAALCLLETHVSPAIVDMGGMAKSTAASKSHVCM